MVVVGIDPGAAGAIVVTDGEKILEGFSFKKRGKETQEDQLLRISGELAQLDTKYRPAKCFLEKIWGMPGQSSNKTFVQGTHWGFVQGTVLSLGWELHLVAAQTWQRAMTGHLPKELPSKEKSIQVATEMFPDYDFLATPRSKKPNDGLTDAALIAKWGLENGS